MRYATPQEDIVDPEIPIIDAHIHLWDRDTYFAQDFIADAQDGHRVVSSVYVECSMAYSQDPRPAFRPVAENLFVLDQVNSTRSSTHRLAEGILAAADLTLGHEVEAVLDAHLEASQGRVRGVRYRVAWDADPVAGYHEPGYPVADLLLDRAFRDGTRAVGGKGLALDLWGFHPQLTGIAAFARDFPELPIVVDHIGGPLGVGRYAAQRAEVFSEWSRGLEALAQVPNVFVKLSGMAISRLGFGYQERGQAASSDDIAEQWHPYIRRCIDAFGPQRAIFGSNYPVDRAAASYPVLLNAYKKMLADLTPEERSLIFSQNAARVYRLQQPVPATGERAPHGSDAACRKN